MPDIRYVCLSDMHLGADSSVLTNIQANSIETDMAEPSPVLTQLVTCLRELIAQNESREKPILVLNGDILEMALTETNKAAMVFERFIELIFPQDGEPLFDKNMLYIPGNHDHHIWENARETQYVNFLNLIPAGTQLDIPWHTTKMFAPDLVREYFLTNLNSTLSTPEGCGCERRLSELRSFKQQWSEVHHFQSWPLCRVALLADEHFEHDDFSQPRNTKGCLGP